MARLRYADDNAIFITRELLRDPTAPPNQKQLTLLELAKTGLQKMTI